MTNPADWLYEEGAFEGCEPMVDDVKKLTEAARRVVEGVRGEPPWEAVSAKAIQSLRAALPGEACPTCGKVPACATDTFLDPDLERAPAAPEVTREEVEAMLELVPVSEDHARVCRSWLALEERLREVEQQKNDYHDQIVDLRDVARAAERIENSPSLTGQHHPAIQDLVAALRRWKGEP